MPSVMLPPTDDAPLRDIAAVERDTGVPRATLRIWERRYGFPAPLRDERGERRYPTAQVELLRLTHRLVQQGQRPARLLADDAAVLRRMAAEGEREAAQAPRPARAAMPLLRLLRGHDAAAVRRALADLLAQDGLEHFAAVEAPRLAAAVGAAWQAGELEVHEEHLFSDCLVDVLRPAITQLGAATRAEAPLALLTTFPQEPHALGLLMAQAMLALQGCPTVSLGVQLPVAQIVAATRAHRADLVGLSFSPSMNPGHVLRGLEELRGMLPPSVRIWAGGSAPVLARRPLAGVRVVQDLRAVPALLAEDFALPPQTVPAGL